MIYIKKLSFPVTQIHDIAKQFSRAATLPARAQRPRLLWSCGSLMAICFCACYDMEGSTETHTMTFEYSGPKVTHAVYAMLEKLSTRPHLTSWGRQVFPKVEENWLIVDTGNDYKIFYHRG